MRQILVISLLFLALAVLGQNKYNYISFNKLQEVKGTEYVIASVFQRGKAAGIQSRSLLFINTKTGASNELKFSGDASIRKTEQVRIDSLGINLIVITGKTVDLDMKNGIDYKDPTQIIVVSTDGQKKTQLTDNGFFVSTYVINELTGTIVITGHIDSNNNYKYDKTDENEILIYDLRSLSLLSKI